MLVSKTRIHDLIGSRTRVAAGGAALMILLAGCGGGSAYDGGSVACGSTSSSIPQVTGKLSAPQGVLAFNAPTGIRRIFAEFFGRNALAALPGVPPVACATVKLIEINSAGAQVGPDIATAQTAADGSFTLGAPAGFTPGPRYVIRAAGSTANLDRLVTDLISQDVDPATQATKSLVLTELAAGGNIQNIQRFQVEELGDRIAGLASDVTGSTTAALVSALTSAAQNDEVVTYSIINLTAPDSIAGTVTDSAGAPLANIKIVVVDFNQWVTRAEARTDASGQYTINLTAGDYIVGALNFTGLSMAASEWWTCNDVPAGPICGVANMFSGGKVTVAAGATTVNFKLEPGARIQGTMTSNATAAALPAVQFALRDFITDEPAAQQRARDDGTFRINVRPGVYTAGVRNRTLLPHASGLYNGPALPALGGAGTAAGGGGAFASEATPVTVAAAYIYTLNFPLIEGGMVSGKVTDGAAPTPNAVTGISVRFYRTAVGDTTGAFVEAARSDLAGNYRLWVRPGDYAVRVRGQIANPTVVAFSANNTPAAVDFGAAVGRVTATLHAPGGQPLSQVKVNVYDDTANAVFESFEITNGDGTVELYAEPTGTYRIEYKVDNGSTTVGSAIHNGTSPTGTQLLQGTLVTFDTAAAPNALGTITLPAGGELKGVVTTVAPLQPGNIVVQVRSGGTNGNFRFTATRTQKDGSYSISVPAGTYNRVCAFVPGTAAACGAQPSLAGTYASADAVVVVAGQSNTLDIAIP